MSDIFGDDFADAIPVGVKPMGPITLTGPWRDESSAPCNAQPCPSCLICGECNDFHGFGKGCTDQTCPLLRPNLPDDWPVDGE